MNHSLVLLGVLSLLLLFNVRCTPEVIEWETKASDMVISDYVIINSDLFKEFGEVLIYTGVENLLRVRGPFTLLLPTDDAMKAYYQKVGVSSYEEIDMEELKKLIYNHLFFGEMSSGTIGQGRLLYQNALGDYVASDFTGIDILINRSAIIVKRDIYTSNGVIHHIDHVLEPVTESVFDKLSSIDGYSIFLAGLESAGLADTLSLIDFSYGSIIARTRYTLLAVPDTLYQREGINSVDELINRYKTGSEAITSKNNGFYQYMEYHCLSETFYFTDFEKSGIYYVISEDNYLSIKVDQDYKINNTADNYTGFIYELSNIPAKNGTIHTVNSLLEVEDGEPVPIIFQTTDYFDLQQGPYYLNYYQRFYDGENTFENIKWEGEFLLYYLKPSHNLMDDDCLNMNGHFWVEIVTRKIRKGTYDLSGFFFFGAGYPVMSCYVDGEYLGPVDLTKGTWGGDPMLFGEVTFDETEKHTIRLESVVPGGLFWDLVKFTPKK